jgi:hypothetical protein
MEEDMSKKSKTCFDVLYNNPDFPPCSKYLGNTHPILTENFAIFKNDNRAYYFLSTNPTNSTTAVGTSLTYTNLQISLTNYLIGLYIFNVQCGKCTFDSNSPIHNDKQANDFIVNTLNTSPNININFSPSLNFIIGNGNSIVDLYTNVLNITPLNYYIILSLHALENDPTLFYGNNSDALADPINIDLASYALRFQK